MRCLATCISPSRRPWREHRCGADYVFERESNELVTRGIPATGKRAMKNHLNSIKASAATAGAMAISELV